MEVNEFNTAEVSEHEDQRCKYDGFQYDEPGLVSAGQVMVPVEQIGGEADRDEQIGQGLHIKGIQVMDIADHSSDISERMLHVVRTKEDPGERHQYKRDNYPEGFIDRGVPFPCLECVSQILPVLSPDERRNEKQCMYRPPGDEGPVGTMPEPADDKDDEYISDRLQQAGLRTAQWYIEIIPEPRGQADMPSPPEFGNGTAQVRIFEVDQQFDAEEFGDTPCDV